LYLCFSPFLGCLRCFFCCCRAKPMRKNKKCKTQKAQNEIYLFSYFCQVSFFAICTYVYGFVCKFVILFFRRFAFCSGSRCFYLLQSTVINNLNKQPKINTNIFEAGPPSFQIHLAPQRANCFSALLWQ